MSSSILNRTAPDAVFDPAPQTLEGWLSGRDAAADDRALKAVVVSLQAGETPAPALLEPAAWAQLRATPDDPQIISRLCGLMAARGAAAPELEILGLELIVRRDPGDLAACATLAQRLAGLGRRSPSDVARGAIAHHLSHDTYPQGAFAPLAACLDAEDADRIWAPLCGRLIAWAASGDDSRAPLEDLVACARLLERQVPDLAGAAGDLAGPLIDQILAAGDLPPPALLQAMIRPASETDLRQGARAAKLVGALHAAGAAIDWRIEVAALQYHLSVSGVDGPLAVTLIRRLSRHAPGRLADLSPGILLAALDHYLSLADFPRGGCREIVALLAPQAVEVPWSRLRDRMAAWGATLADASDVLAELVECAAFLGRPLSDLGDIGESRLTAAYHRLQANGRASPPELEILALRSDLKADPTDGAAAARLAGLLHAAGEPVPWAVERPAMEHHLARDPANGPLAATYLQRLAESDRPEDLLSVAPDIVCSGLHHRLDQTDYSRGAFRQLVALLARSDTAAPWHRLVDRLSTWARRSRTVEPLAELVECADLLGRPLTQLGFLSDPTRIEIYEHLQRAGRPAPRELEIWALESSGHIANLDGPRAARLVGLLHEAGRPITWPLQRAALQYYLAQDPIDGGLAANMLSGLAQHDDPDLAQVPENWLTAALAYYLSLDTYPEGGFRLLVGLMAARRISVPWRDLLAALTGPGLAAIKADDAFAELLVCARLAGRPASDIPPLDDARLERVMARMTQLGEEAPVELELRALRLALARVPDDGIAAARLIGLLHDRAEPVEWGHERVALEHLMEVHPEEDALAAHLAQRLFWHGEPAPSALALRALRHFLFLRPPSPMAVRAMLETLALEGALPDPDELLPVLVSRATELDEFAEAATDLADGVAFYGLNLDRVLAGARPDGPETSAPAWRLAPIEPAYSAYLAARDEALEVSAPLPYYLEGRPGGAQVSHQSLKTRLYGAQIAAVSDLPREVAHEFCARILARAPGDTVDRVLIDLACVPLAPGPAYLHRDSPEQLLEFLIDAWSRGRTARDLGYPVTPIFSMSKSGSSFSAAFVSRTWDVPAGVTSVCHAVSFPPWLQFAATWPLALHDHAILSRADLAKLRALGLRRLALQIRDPRQCLLSLAHHALNTPNITMEWAGEFMRRSGFEAYIDAAIERYAPEYAEWLGEWRIRAAEEGFDLHFLRYEEMARNPRDFFSGLLSVAGAPGRLHDRLDMGLAGVEASRLGGDLNYRNGKSDEWRTVLTPGQIDRISVHCADAFRGLYAF